MSWGSGSTTSTDGSVHALARLPRRDRRRATDLATNLGAGVNYQFNDRVGVGADYRTFFVHRDDTTPKVNRFTAGLTFSSSKSRVEGLGGPRRPLVFRDD
jgi:hypothetical protein